MTIPTGLVKSTIQAPGAASSRARSAISSITGTVRIALAKPPAPGRLLADAAARQWHRLVGVARALAADADLHEDHIGAVERAVQLAGDHEPPGESLLFEHPPRQAADDLAPLGVDVVQHELADLDPLALAREPGHQLRRVGRAAADHRDAQGAHPFTPVSVTPSTNAFWAAKNRAITGA